MVHVEPLRRDWATALAESDEIFSETFGIQVVPGWAVFPESLPDALSGATEEGDRWGTYLFFDDDRALVGWGGWRAPPVDGVAELGYAVAPARRGRGVATAVVRDLLKKALEMNVERVIAHTLAEESASTGVLRKVGFEFTGEVADPDAPEDAVWRWELNLSQAL